MVTSAKDKILSVYDLETNKRKQVRF